MANSTPTPGDRIVKAYEQELEHLDKDIVRMGGLAESQITRAIEAFVQRDPDLAQEIISDDDLIDDLNHEIDINATRLLALRQPMAEDLRQVVAALKISSDLERIGDYAANIAKRSITLSAVPSAGPVQSIPAMSKFALQMLKTVLDAYIARDADKAIEAWHADETLDNAYAGVFREALQMSDNPGNVAACTQLLFIAKNVERIGDHVTNVAETIYFLVHGERLRAARPRGRGAEALDLSLTGMTEKATE